MERGATPVSRLALGVLVLLAALPSPAAGVNVTAVLAAERAQGFLEELEEQGFEPDVVTYNTLLCRKGKLRDALHLFDVMPHRGVEPDLVSNTVLMDGLCKSWKSTTVQSFIPD